MLYPPFYDFLQWQNLDFTKGNENETRCKREITTGDLRRVMCYLLCMFAGLYGAGNIMSINRYGDIRINEKF
jgi:hypothetical protein